MKIGCKNVYCAWLSFFFICLKFDDFLLYSNISLFLFVNTKFIRLKINIIDMLQLSDLKWYFRIEIRSKHSKKIYFHKWILWNYNVIWKFNLDKYTIYNIQRKVHNHIHSIHITWPSWILAMLNGNAEYIYVFSE